MLNKDPHNEEDRMLDAVLSVAILIMLAALASVMLGCADSKKPKDGKDGQPGAIGTPGTPGEPGHSPIIVTRSANALECPTGGLVVTVDLGSPNVICNGLDGAEGQIGGTGPQGIPGQDITPVTLVKLCPGTSTYPTVFIEYGMCIADQMWGVYSANGGFLALLPPGNYSSNAIGSSCNLTIGLHCQVTH